MKDSTRAKEKRKKLENEQIRRRLAATSRPSFVRHERGTKASRSTFRVAAREWAIRFGRFIHAAGAGARFPCLDVI
jgi:hypothetical protein